MEIQQNNSPAQPVAPATDGAALQTYEDCLKAIETGENDTNVDNVKATLRRLKSFFTNRVGKKTRSKERGGFESTKTALEQRDGKFSKYEAKPIDGAGASAFSKP
jgi:hypothetical protein